MKKILQLTTYDIDDADHGGKLRCLNINRSLSCYFEIVTMSIEISDSEEVNGFKYKLDRDKFYAIGGNKYLIDIGINDYINKCNYLLIDIEEKVSNFNPDIIIFEQPYLWPLFKRIIKKLKKKVFLVNSTQNIEYELKKEIYFSRFKKSDSELLLGKVFKLEKELAENSNMSISVSNKDHDYVSSINPEIPSYIFGNGSSTPTFNNKSDKWLNKFKETGKKNLVFVGSAHPPNIDGLKALVIESNRLGDDSLYNLWVLGGVAEFIKDDDEIKSYFPSWVHVVGKVSSEDLDSAILAADGILLPIWHGGGSNLKTAQAILSGNFILASNYAFRGFEKFTKLPNVIIRNTPEELAYALKNIDIPSEKVLQNIDEIAKDLTWDGILNTLPEKLINAYYQWSST